MPKSFLVKKNIKSKVSSSGLDSEDENERNAEQKNEERNVIIKRTERSLLRKPYASESKDGRTVTTKRAMLSLDTPASGVTVTVEKSKSFAAQPDALKHIGKEQISWQNVKVLPRNAENPSECQHLKAKHQCIRCERTYSSNAALLKHQRYYCSFFQTKSFTCKYCDKVYQSLGALKMHIRTHTLPCNCVICGKAFSRPWLLQGHIRTHTGEKPYECTCCNRAFADRSNLRAHLQTHSQVKKYQCEHCTKTFSRMSLLVKHRTSSACAM